jgi:SAM-dependent methyltransferase
MPVSNEERKSYHPAIGDDFTAVGGRRDYRRRLSIIQKNVAMDRKTVLDLGCSGGFFSFNIAKVARKVTAVDADEDIIEQNRQVAERLHLRNIEFIHQKITPQFVRSLPKYDVAVFMSVLHHMISGSQTYEWSMSKESEKALEIVQAISERAERMVFEMGRPDENFTWASDLGEIVTEPREWVKEKLFAGRYSNVIILPGPAYGRFPFNCMPSVKNRLIGNRLGCRLLRFLGVDQRDFREIYVASK